MTSNGTASLRTLKSKNGSFSDREEIRRRLAMESDSDDQSATTGKPGTIRKSHYSKHLQNQSNLQICFLNENPQEFYAKHELDSEKEDEDDNGASRTRYKPRRQPRKADDGKGSNLLDTELQPQADFELCLFKHKLVNPLEFPAYHSLIYTEAKSALARAKDIARSHLIIENRLCRKSLNELLELLEEEKCATHKLSKCQLKSMSIAKLQIIVNHIHSQIEALNDKLVKLLFERDELLMEQDSLLVDIDDETIFLFRKYKKLKGKQRDEREIKC